MPTPIDSYLPVDPATRLRCRHMQPKGSARRGSVLLLQGRGDCLEQYTETMGELAARGYSVYAFDWRGQGLSSRTLTDRLSCHVHDFSEYLADLHHVIKRFWQTDKRCRVILAHSLGGHVALRYLAQHPLAVSGAVLCAPMIGIQTRRWPKALAPMIIEGMIGLGFREARIPGSRSYRPSERRFEGNPLTSDERRFQVLPRAIQENPELEVDGPTFGWVDAAFRSMAALTAEGVVERIKTPVEILIGDSDVVVDLEAARGVARRLPNCRFHLLPGARHELMMEADDLRAEFWRCFEETVARVGPTA